MHRGWRDEMRWEKKSVHLFNSSQLAEDTKMGKVDLKKKKKASNRVREK